MAFPQIQLNSKKFLGILVKSMKIIQPKSPIIMYSTGLFKVKDKKLYLTVTDMDHTLTSEIDVDGDDCEFILKIQDMHDIVKKITTKINILIEDTKIVISNENIKIELLLIKEEFIKTSLENVQHIVSIDPQSFNYLFSFFPITTEEWNFTLQVQSNYIQATGNNRKCLVFSQVNTNHINSEIFSISYKTLNLLCKHNVEKIDVYKQNNQLVFKFENGILWSRLLNQTATNYERILQKRSKGEVVLIDRKSLIESLNRVSLLASKFSRTVKLLFQENTLLLQASDVSRGKAEESLTVESQIINGFLALNCDTLVNALKTIHSNTISIYYTGHVSHLFICSEDKSTIHVIMPLNISS